MWRYRAERETTQMSVFRAEMEAEKTRLMRDLAVAKERAEQCKRLAEEADGRLRPLVDEIDELRRDVTSKDTTITAMEAAAEVGFPPSLCPLRPSPLFAPLPSSLPPRTSLPSFHSPVCPSPPSSLCSCSMQASRVYAVRERLKASDDDPRPNQPSEPA